MLTASLAGRKPSVTTWQHAHALGCCVPVANLLREQQPASAAKLGPQSSVPLRDLNVEPGRLDERRIEVIANGLPLSNGAQVAVDTTLAAPLTSAGAPRRIRGRTAGAALQVARRAKERAYPELADSRRCHLTVLGIEVGGRWSSEASTFVRQFARCRARAMPAPSRAACTSALALRWSSVLSIAAARAFAASLLGLSIASAGNVDGNLPLMSDLLADSSEVPLLASRMP